MLYLFIDMTLSAHIQADMFISEHHTTMLNNHTTMLNNHTTMLNNHVGLDVRCGEAAGSKCRRTYSHYTLYDT